MPQVMISTKLMVKDRETQKDKESRVTRRNVEGKGRNWARKMVGNVDHIAERKS